MFNTGKSKCKSAELSVMVIRANGKQEDLGVVSYYNHNPIKQLIWTIKNLIKKHFSTNKGN